MILLLSFMSLFFFFFFFLFFCFFVFSLHARNDEKSSAIIVMALAKVVGKAGEESVHESFHSFVILNNSKFACFISFIMV